jgi:hypothetical protein
MSFGLLSAAGRSTWNLRHTYQFDQVRVLLQLFFSNVNTEVLRIAPKVSRFRK